MLKTFEAECLAPGQSDKKSKPGERTKIVIGTGGAGGVVPPLLDVDDTRTSGNEVFGSGARHIGGMYFTGFISVSKSSEKFWKFRN